MTSTPQPALADTPLAPDDRTLELVLERELAAPPERVFRAWTEREQLVRWFAPNPEIETEAEIDVRVGGDYRIRMGDWEVAGRYRRVEAPRLLEFTLAWRHEPRRASLVTLELSPTAGGGTLLRLTHTRNADRAEVDGHREGWSANLDRLAALLTGRGDG